MDRTLEQAVERWRQAHVIDDATAAAIRAHELARQQMPAMAGVGGPGGVSARADEPSTPISRTAVPTASARQGEQDRGLLSGGRGGLFAEGLAYVGAALAFGAGAALFGELWIDLSGLARTLVAAAGTLALGGAAAALGGPTGDVVRRLRSLLAALAAVGAGLTVGVGLYELAETSGELAATAGGATALAAAVVVHRQRPSWPTTLAAGGALLTTLLAGEALIGLDIGEVPAGVTVAAVGLGWAALGWAGWLRPRSAFEVTGLLAGGVGTQILAAEAFPLTALAIGLLVSTGAVTISILEERSSPAVIGGLGFAVFAPQLVFRLFGETIGGPLALFVAGLSLVAVAVLVLRQRSAQ